MSLCTANYRTRILIPEVPIYKDKCKVVLVSRHFAMDLYKGYGGKVSWLLCHGTGWKQVASSYSGHFIPTERVPGTH
jgi:hypothetical protein